jgi:transposase-like protein
MLLLITPASQEINQRKQSVPGTWLRDETYIRVRGWWICLYQTIDSSGDTVNLWCSERRLHTVARPFLP